DPPYPRSYVRVSDDSSAALASGQVATDVLTTLTAAHGAPRDVVVTNGPFVRVSSANEAGKGLGMVLRPAADGTVHLNIDMQSPEWAPCDMIEIFATQTYDVVGGAAIAQSGNGSPALVPTMCFTARTGGLGGADTCNRAALGAFGFTVRREPLAGFV